MSDPKHHSHKPTSEALVKSARGLLNGVAASAAETAFEVVSAPIKSVVGPIAAGVQSVASVVGGVADTVSGLVSGFSSLFGFDMPTSVAAPTAIIRRFLPSLPYSSGLDDSTTLAMTVGSRPCVIPDLASSKGDEMALTVMASTPMLLLTTTFDQTTAAGAVVGTIYVNPKYVPQRGADANGMPLYMPTFCAKVCAPFSYWRGTMRYMVKVVCSTFHSVRLRAVFIPNDSADPTSYDDLYTRVIDVQGSTDFTISVPFFHPRAWARESIGRLVFQLESKIASMSDVTTTSVMLVVYTAASGDLMVREPRPEYYIPQDLITPIGYSSPRDQFELPFDGICSTAVAVGFEDPYFADHCTHLNDLLHRPEPWLRVEALQGFPAAGLLLYPQNLPSYAYHANSGTFNFQIPSTTDASICDSSGATGNGGMTPLSTLQNEGYVNFVRPTALDHFADCFKFQRGGMRLKIPLSPRAYAGDSDVPGVTGALVTASRPPSARDTVCINGGTPDTVTYPVYFPSSNGADWIMADTLANQIQPPPLAVQFCDAACAMEVEVPHNSPALFVTTGDGRLVTGTTGPLPYPSVFTEDNQNMVLLTASVDLASSATADLGVCMGAWRSTADDYRLHFLKGPRPSYYYIRGLVADTSVQYPRRLIALY